MSDIEVEELRDTFLRKIDRINARLDAALSRESALRTHNEQLQERLIRAESEKNEVIRLSRGLQEQITSAMEQLEELKKQKEIKVVTMRGGPDRLVTGESDSLIPKQ